MQYWILITDTRKPGEYKVFEEAFLPEIRVPTRIEKLLTVSWVEKYFPDWCSHCGMAEKCHPIAPDGSKYCINAKESCMSYYPGRLVYSYVDLFKDFFFDPPMWRVVVHTSKKLWTVKTTLKQACAFWLRILPSKSGWVGRAMARRKKGA